MGEEIFKPEICDTQDQSNQHKVNFHRGQKGNITKISRYNLSEGLQRRLRMPGGIVVDLGGFEEEIEALFEGHHFNALFDNKRDKEIKEFKKNILKNILTGNTSMKSGGIGFEELIKVLLKLEGYNAEIQSKNKFPGFADADIIATKEDRFSPAKLLIQVKHHQGSEGTWGAEQLLEILKSNEDYFSEYALVLITTAEPSSELIEMCKKQAISLYSGNDIADWIFESLPKMDFNTKKQLYISDIPIVIN